MRLVLASSNAGKLGEIEALLAGTGIVLVPQSALGIADAEETGLTFIENALIKARHAARQSGLPALADDSGLCVAALDGAPGLRSARYAGSHGDSAANIARLLAALDGVPRERRGAFFHCCIALLRHADDPAPIVCEGRWHGRVLDAPRGAGGFGYDPVFHDDVLGASAAELEPSRKHRASHRGRALALLKRRIGEFAGAAPAGPGD